MASPPVSAARRRRPPLGRFRALSRALLALGPLWAWGLAAAQTTPAELPPIRAPLVPPVELGGGGATPQPQRPDAAALKPQPPARFEASLDALVRDGVVSTAERAQLRNGSAPLPLDISKQQQACRSGALSAQECRTGLILRWHGRKGGGGVNANGSADGDIAGGERLGADGRPHAAANGAGERPVGRRWRQLSPRRCLFRNAATGTDCWQWQPQPVISSNWRGGS